MSKLRSEEFGRRPVHPFPARMATTIALNAMSHSRRKLKVLDPMMGSGTVLAMARATGHHAIGVDIDPLAVLISGVWTSAIDKAAVKKCANQVLARAQKEFYQLPLGRAYPNGADKETKQFVRYWFDPHARRQLACLANAIRRSRNKKVRNVLWCCFSQLIITKRAGASRALDLAHSRPHKEFDVGPIKPFSNFLYVVERVLKNCLGSMEPRRGPRPRIQLGDARRLPLPNKSIDLVLTSPPYLNAIDYLRCSKFSLVWMGYSAADLRSVRSISIGSEVGDYSEEHADLISKLKLDAVLSPRTRAVLSRYVRDMKEAIQEVSRVLSPRGRAIYVIGENTIDGKYIQNAKNCGSPCQKGWAEARSAH